MAAAEAEAVVASSTEDAGIAYWDLKTGMEKLRYRSCTSTTPHGLACVAGRFLASSQLRQSPSPSGSLFYWTWTKAQPEVKSFPAELINPISANSDGTFLVGGGSSGDIYLWEVASGKLLKKWQAHYRAVTCLLFSEDESLLVSGAEDGGVKVWSICKLFDTSRGAVSSQPYEFSFTDHTLKVADIVSGYGGCNAIIVSSSEDRTCKVWSLAKGKLLRTIEFPAIVDAVALDPGEHVFYAGSRDGKIYIAALNAVSSPSASQGSHIVGSLSDHSKAVTCLAYSSDGISLVSGSEDGTVRVWNTKTRHVVRVLKHGKGPVNNVIIVRHPIRLRAITSETVDIASSRKQSLAMLPPPLARYIETGDENAESRPVKVLLKPVEGSITSEFLSSQVMMSQIKELQNQGSSASVEMELERLKVDCTRSLQMLEQWQKMYQDLLKLSTNELLDECQGGDTNRTA